MRWRNLGAAGMLAVIMLFSAMTQEIAVAQRREREPEPHMAAALEHLRAAQQALDQATPDKGGHRVRAIGLTRDAISQVEQGIRYFQEHDRR